MINLKALAGTLICFALLYAIIYLVVTWPDTMFLFFGAIGGSLVGFAVYDIFCDIFPD